MHGVRATNRLFAGLGETEEAHLPLAHELGHRADDVLDRHGAIHTMLIEQIDVVRLQAPQRTLHCLTNVRRPAIETDVRAVLELEAELGRDYHGIPLSFQRAAYQLLVRIRSVRLGGVEERHAKLDRAMDGGDGLLLVALLGSAVAVTH